jgi:HEAT repeat protein
VRRVLIFAVCLTGSACAPPACSDPPERAARKDVKLLVEDDGPLAEAARTRLVARGASAIAVLETGLYAANPPARLRIVRALQDIRSREAAPILAHLAAKDPDENVRAAAKTAISSLPTH